ncbi:R3H domain protein [compost metagenome]
MSEEELNKSIDNVTAFMNDFIKEISEDTKFTISKIAKEGLSVIIEGNDVGFLIGHRGATLYSLQNIISAIANKGIDKKVIARLDIKGYKEARIKTLEDFAEKMANTVIKTGKPITLEPMKAYERKVIHSKLQNNDKVATKSIGEEPKRKVVITLK